MESGPFWMVMASIGFATMGLFVKLGSKDFTTSELVFYRCFFSFVAVGGAMLVRGVSFRTPVLGRQFSRAISGTISLMMFFYAIAHLPLGTAMTLNYTSPMFLALFTTLWLREKASSRIVLSMVLGFVGVVILLHPTFARDQWLAGMIGLASGFLAGIAILNVRMLGDAGEPEWRTVFYFSLVASIVGAVWMLAGRPSPVTAGNVGVLLGMGACATIAQLSMTRAYRKGRSLVVASLAYLTVLVSSLYGIVFWQDNHSWGAWLAMALIIASGIVTTWRVPAEVKSDPIEAD